MSDFRLVSTGGVELETVVIGTGEPVVFIHGSVIADAFAPLLTQTALRERHQLISYHRRGFAGSTHPAQPLSMAEQAADCAALMDALAVPRAHIVGHSYGALIALQLALDTPDKVHSLGLLEAALTSVPSMAQMMAGLGSLMSLYQAGRKAEAIDGFERAVVGPDWRGMLDENVPGAFEQAVADTDTFFAQELPALQTWSFTADDARRITAPALVVRGANSATLWPGFHESCELLLDWLPQADGFVVPDVTHGLQMQNPRGVAEALTAFLARHRLPVAV